MKSLPGPPLLGTLLLRLRRLGRRREQIEGDLNELFQSRSIDRGRRYATLRYCADVVSLWAYGTGRVAMAAAAHDRGIGGLMFDVRFAARLLRRQPGGAAVAVLGLALAIGVSTATFAWLNAAMFAPFGVRDPSTVVQVGQLSSNGGWSNFRLFEDFRQLRESTRLVQVEAWWRETVPMGETDPETVRVMPVSGGFFRTLGVNAAVGRVLTEADDSTGAPPTALLNYTYWRNRFGADEAVVGQTVRLMGAPFTVIGVAERGFNGPQPTTPPAFWVPLAVQGRLRKPQPGRDPRVWVIGRMADGATRRQAESELDRVGAHLQSRRIDQDGAQQLRAQLRPAADVASGAEGAWWFVGTVVVLLGLVLALACSNVAHALFAGAIARRREVGVRLALGACRGRLVRQLLTESLVLSALSSGLGTVLAFWLLPMLTVVWPLPATVDLTPDLRVLGFLVGVTVVVGCAAGLAPARFGVRGDLVAPLRGNSASAGRTGRAGRTRSFLVSTQAGASMVLLIVAALFARAMVRVTQHDLGFDADRLVSVTVNFDAGDYDAPRAAAYWDRVMERLVAVPGVAAAALAAHVPFGGSYGRVQRIQSAARQHAIYFNETSSGYFDAVGLTLVRGRTYTVQEVATGAGVAVITERLARSLWPGQDALGATLELVDAELAATQVIGIVADAVTLTMDLDADALYRPLAPEKGIYSRLVVRVEGDATILAKRVLEAVTAMDPSVLPTATPVGEALEQALLLPRGFAKMSAALGVIALGLAVTGVFGLTAFAVEQRVGEIGLRLAVGAESADVARLMLRDGLRPVLAGLVAGLLAAMAATRFLTAVLHGVDALDPLSILAATLVLTGAAAAAAAVPARRAARLDPAIALRRG